ncbi:hypothetical protein DFH28DRAFT_1161350 [Melampsora americana]|nr:hypothetical protein DFH28DRAFT_1161350 [Melampsora americana]
MVQTGSIVLGLTAILSALTVENFQNDECEKIEGLEASYLTCSRVIDRVHWTPAMSKLNRDRIPVPSLDYIAILDLKTHAHKKLSLTNLPEHILKHGLHTHGLDLYVESYTKESEDQSSVTLYMVNHNPPDVLHQASSLGAQSVIEVFKTNLEAQKLNIRLLSNSFYVTNDHAKKFGWPFVLDHDSNSIVHCSLNGSTSPDCIVAVHGYAYSNGIAKMPRSIDNIYVTEKGSVYLAMVPKAYDLSRTLDKPGSRVSPTEVWRVSNATEQDKFFGGRLKVEKVFADDGHMVSMTTCVAVYEDKLYLTGIASPYVSVCKMKDDPK